MIHTPPGADAAPGPEYVESTAYFDAEHPAVQAFARRATQACPSPVDRAVRLFYAVRDGWRYDPFGVRLTAQHFVASRVLERPTAFCIAKANVLIAAARALGIPAALGLSDVVNHLTTEKLKARMGGTTVFIHHGYAVLFLGGRWIKAAPAFNIELCTRFGVRPTEFDGRDHAVFQEFDVANRRHMEYVRDHGMWSDFPFDMVARDFRAFYPPVLFAESASAERFEDGAPLR